MSQQPSTPGDRVALFIDIARPIDEVRRHCFDIPYHAARGLHPHIRYTIKSIAPQRIEFVQEVSILKLKHRDHCTLMPLPNGDLLMEITSGVGRGFKLRFRFEELGPSMTRMHGDITLPLPGIRRWIAPLFRRAVLNATRRAFQEDKADLECLNYRHHPRSG